MHILELVIVVAPHVHGIFVTAFVILDLLNRLFHQILLMDDLRIRIQFLTIGIDVSFTTGSPYVIHIIAVKLTCLNLEWKGPLGICLIFPCLVFNGTNAWGTKLAISPDSLSFSSIRNS